MRRGEKGKVVEKLSLLNGSGERVVVDLRMVTTHSHGTTHTGFYARVPNYGIRVEDSDINKVRAEVTRQVKLAGKPETVEKFLRVVFGGDYHAVATAEKSARNGWGMSGKAGVSLRVELWERATTHGVELWRRPGDVGFVKQPPSTGEVPPDRGLLPTRDYDVAALIPDTPQNRATLERILLAMEALRLDLRKSFCPTHLPSTLLRVDLTGPHVLGLPDPGSPKVRRVRK